MKGIMFNLLEEVVSDLYGLDEWDALLEESQTPGVYSSIGSYPDEELLRFLEIISVRKNIPATEILRWYGKNAFPYMCMIFGQRITKYNDVISLLLALNDIIHPEVRKLYPGASVPSFEYELSADRKLTIIYSSAKKMCALGEGLIEGAAAYYGEPILIQQSQCMLRGDSCCHIHVHST
jgi:hypothetical protein